MPPPPPPSLFVLFVRIALLPWSAENDGTEIGETDIEPVARLSLASDTHPRVFFAVGEDSTLHLAQAHFVRPALRSGSVLAEAPGDRMSRPLVGLHLLTPQGHRLFAMLSRSSPCRKCNSTPDNFLAAPNMFVVMGRCRWLLETLFRCSRRSQFRCGGSRHKRTDSGGATLQTDFPNESLEVLSLGYRTLFWCLHRFLPRLKQVQWLVIGSLRRALFSCH